MTLRHVLSEDELSTLRSEGYVNLRHTEDALSTLELAKNIGTVLDLQENDPAYPSTEIDILTPKDKTLHQPNRYHGIFGLDEYPAHTDLAHWFRPPRYILLRALRGTPTVKTFIYPAEALLDFLPKKLAARALFFPRTARIVTALPFQISRGSKFTARFDPVFIRPANAEAKHCMDIFRSDSFLSTRKSIILSKPRYALILDNWRCLHGRSSVPASEKNRAIERVYLENIYGISG